MSGWREDLRMRRRAKDGVCEIDCFDPAKVSRARAALPPEQALQRAGEALKTLGHPNRLRILKALDGRELCVCDVARVLGLSLSGTSQQLKDLRHLGAVEYRVSGKLAYYTLADGFWLDLANSVIDRFFIRTRRK